MLKLKLNPATYEDNFNMWLKRLSDEKIINRIWNKDYTVWRDDPTEISNRLGWLDCVETAKDKLDEINGFVDEIISEGFTHALLLGMGGSSLAPEVFSKILGTQNGFLKLSVLDSTHPDQVNRMLKELNPAKTLYIVSTKSGGTVETISFMKRFYNTVMKNAGKENVGNHFVAITDPGSGLEATAKKLNFRKIFINDPNIGGRYSALSLFGLVPAALIGTDLVKLLNRVEEVIVLTKADNNSIAQIGVALGMLAEQGVDKATFILSNKFKPFGAWVEQLIAESTGKEGKGILPVEGEEILKPENYGKDRVFININLKDDNNYHDKIAELKSAGFPVIEIELNEIYQLGAQYFAWEMITVIASWVINIQPFDQPNVEEAKVIARKMMSEYFEKGELPKQTPALNNNGINVLGNTGAESIEKVLPDFLTPAIKGKNYVAIQAYVEMNNKAKNILHLLRTKIQRKYGVAVTVGFGPRFLHSTGQLHKGDAGNGLFVQFVSQSKVDVEIPDEAGKDKSTMTFGVLIKAQAIGDREALLANNRKVITFEITENVVDDISKIFSELN